MQEPEKLDSASGLNIESQGSMGPSIENESGHTLFILRNTEERIWEGVKKGDQNALGELYTLFVDSLFAYGASLTKDREYVMDCIHDLFLDLYKYRKGLSNTDNIKYYLIKSLKRKILRKYKSKIIPFSTLFPDSNPQDRNDYIKSHEEDLIQSEYLIEKDRKLNDALNTLTNKQRRGLFLKFTQQRSYKEISEVLGISIGSARTVIYRALKSLR